MSVTARPVPNFDWVDAGLADIGLELDLDPRALPLALRSAPALTVTALMQASLNLAAAPVSWQSPAHTAASPTGRWVAEVGRIPGNPYFISRTVVNAPRCMTREDFVAFAVDECMVDVAASWDATFHKAAFSHIILRSGETFRVGERPSSGVVWSDMAKVMRWQFNVAGLSRRELFSVYVSHADEHSVTTCYFPVRGRDTDVAPGCVRARLTVPCLDRAEYEGERCTAFVHLASAQLGGWMPDALVGTNAFARAFLKAARSEADQLTDICDRTGKAGTALASAQRKDGATVSNVVRI